MQIPHESRTACNPQCSDWFLFTSDCSKHCIIFIGASRSQLCESKRKGEETPSLDCGNADSPPLIFFSFSCEISGSQPTQDIWAWGLAGDGWRSIYITLPGASSLLPSPFPLSFFFFYLVNMAERAHPERASWVFKRRAWSEGLGGCGICDHEACGPFPAVFSQQKVCLCRNQRVFVCMQYERLLENNLWHTAIFYITLI